ncbi:MAG: SDR family oxidoreductase [Opitutaceae bacterium]|nr:SDR family oxidoreductase [Opitutaceae bacterium]
MFSLNEKNTLITGAGSGIGTAIAALFAKAGAFVYAADIDHAAAEAQANAIRAAGGRAEALGLDVTQETSCAEAARLVSKRHEALDVLVNNAGIGSVGTLLEATGADLDRLYAVNVRGMFNVTKAFLPAMVERHSGNIINMASIGGVVGIRDRVAYCTTKFAVVGFTKCLALDHAAAGIRSNCICPGRVETPFVKARLQEYADPEAACRSMASTQLFGRMIRPDEIAAAALYLAAPESHMVTGTTFLIECGWTAGK